MRGLRTFVCALAVVPVIASAAVSKPAVEAVPGKPALLLSGFDLAAFGLSTNEFFVSGTATSYKLQGKPPADGHWQVSTADTAPYVTRFVVVRPTDPNKFNGTVVVEWLNVSAGADASPDWNAAHRLLMRDGYAYVGVSAQKVGIEGGSSLGSMGVPLKKVDATRYARLTHPGDAYSYDIFSQVGKVLGSEPAVLGGLKPKHFLAVGESQSAIYLTTYVNAVDPLAKVFDGFLIHSRFGPPSRLDGASIINLKPEERLPPTRLRNDLRVPVVTVITETDLVGANLAGFYAARQPDNQRLRIWEVPGTSHADNYTFGGGFVDSGKAPLDKLAATYRPMTNVAGSQLAKPANFGPQHHYVVEAALWSLNQWVTTGRAPPKAARIKTRNGQNEQQPTLVLDSNGEAEGGIRTPWVDVPTARLSGVGNSGGTLAFLAGVGEPFDQATLERLYPDGKREYLRKFEDSLSSAIKSGFILPADKWEILELAASTYPDSQGQ